VRLTLPVRNLLAELEAGPLTLDELADRLQYRRDRVLNFIQDARVNGAHVFCRPGAEGEPATFEVHKGTVQRHETIDDTPALEGQSEE